VFIGLFELFEYSIIFSEDVLLFLKNELGFDASVFQWPGFK